MKNAIIAGVATASILLAACGKQNKVSPGPVPRQEPASAAATSSPVAVTSPLAATGSQAVILVSTPVAQPVLTVWQEGNKAGAINLFLEANWNARPIFPAGMALSLTDGQINGLSEPDRQLRTGEMLGQMELIRQLAQAVAGAGREAIAKGDAARARKCYTALKQFGAALDSPGGQQVVRATGRASVSMANTGLAKLPSPP